jgi:RNA polymerase sigma factor (sigma-70 family)
MRHTILHLLAGLSHSLAGEGPWNDVDDRDLLARFAEARDEAAFAALLDRHGRLVWGVCRSLLAGDADAEDAFQATFVALFQGAAKIRQARSLAPWLHGTATRIARKARLAAARRRLREHRAAKAEVAPATVSDQAWEALDLAVHDEITRLPPALRVAFVLCVLEGHRHQDAAAQLGVPIGTVSARVSRARKTLMDRLSARDLTPVVAASAVACATASVSANVPQPLLLLAHRHLADGFASASRTILHLATPMAGGMSMTAKWLSVTVLIAGGLVATISGVWSAFAQEKANDTPGSGLAAGKENPPPAAGGKQPRGDRADRNGDPLPEGAQARLGTIRFRHDHPYLHLMSSFSRNGKVLATGGNNEIRLWNLVTGKLIREIHDGYGYSELFFAPDGRWLAGRLAGRDSWTFRLWNPETGRRLLDIPADGQAKACSPDGKQIVTTGADSVSLWDTVTGKRTAHLRGGHKGQATHVAFTADGKALVTISLDRRGTNHSACHWDLASSRLLKTVELKLPRQMHNVCLSPDGQSLAVSPRGQQPVFLLDTTTGRECLTLQGKLAGGGYGLAFSRDGKTLATSGVDLQKWPNHAEVAFWDVTTGKLLRQISMPAQAALHLCFAPNGRTLLSAGQEPMVHLWNVATGKPVHGWSGHTGMITALAFTSDGTTLVSGSHDRTVRLWDVKSGRHLRELQGHRGSISGVAVTPDGKTIVSSGIDGCIRVQTPDGKDSRRILLGRPPEELDSPVDHVYALGISPDGKTAATYSLRLKSGALYHVWDLSTAKAVMERQDPSRVISTRTFSPDARLVLQHVFGGDMAGTGGALPGGGGGGGVGVPGSTLAVVEDVASGQQVLALPLPEQPGNIGTFSPDSRVLLTVRYQAERRKDGWYCDNTLHVWELASRKVRQTITWSGWARFIQAAAAPDGSTVATARDDQTIQLWDLATGKELLRRAGFLSQVGHLVFSPDGRSLASGHGDGTILVWDVAVMRRQQESPKARPDQKRLTQWWSDLAGDDAGKAYRAIDRLVAAPGQTVNWLGDQLQPIREVPADQLRSLIADLDSSRFARRQAASRQLASLADRARPALRAALKADLSAEQRQHIRRALATLRGVPPANTLRHLRAVEVLERIGTPQARQLLEKLAGGAPEAWLTNEAKAALERTRLRWVRSGQRSPTSR